MAMIIQAEMDSRKRVAAFKSSMLNQLEIARLHDERLTYGEAMKALLQVVAWCNDENEKGPQS